MEKKANVLCARTHTRSISLFHFSNCHEDNRSELSCHGNSRAFVWFCRAKTKDYP
uniref:Uncharacterized protein n=1 Tax=Octopus bimaculoides TaxID=37653 RepID=A0A0L8FMQ8_OCTBM